MPTLNADITLARYQVQLGNACVASSAWRFPLLKQSFLAGITKLNLVTSLVELEDGHIILTSKISEQI